MVPAIVLGKRPSLSCHCAAEFRADIPTFAHYLRAGGYRTVLSGKMHFCGPDQMHGFEERLTTRIPNYMKWPPALQPIADSDCRPLADLTRFLNELAVN